MRARLNLFLSHSLVAVVAAVLLGRLAALEVSIWVQFGSVIGVSVVLSGLSAFFLGRHADTKSGLEVIERAVVDGEKPAGNTPFDRCAERLQAHMQRWSSVASQGRSQVRELDSVLALFEQDEDARKKCSNPAKQVRQWLSSLGRDSNATLRELIECNQEIDSISKQVTASAQQQNEIATRANREIETLSGDLGDFKQQTTKAHQVLQASRSHTEETVNEMGQLTDGQAGVRTEIGNCEHKVRSMRDHTAEIEAMVQSIQEQSAQADMMALNASIESVRAGELGRGFASVAEEIRKLANQINAAAAATLDKVSVVDTEVEEASSMLASERDNLGKQTSQLTRVRQLLGELEANAEQFHDQLTKLDGVSENQSRRVTEVEGALEGILSASDNARNQVVEVSWKTRSLTELISRLMDVLEPLMVSYSEDEDAPIPSPPPQEEESEDEVSHENVALCVG